MVSVGRLVAQVASKGLRAAGPGPEAAASALFQHCFGASNPLIHLGTSLYALHPMSASVPPDDGRGGEEGGQFTSEYAAFLLAHKKNKAKMKEGAALATEIDEGGSLGELGEGPGVADLQRCWGCSEQS